MTPEYSARLQQATAGSVMDHLRRVRGSVPANILAQGLATALAEMLGHVNARHRAETLARCMSIVSAAERRS